MLKRKKMVSCPFIFYVFPSSHAYIFSTLYILESPLFSALFVVNIICFPAIQFRSKVFFHSFILVMIGSFICFPKNNVFRPRKITFYFIQWDLILEDTEAVGWRYFF